MKKTKLRRLLPLLITLLTVIVCMLGITVMAEEAEVEEVRTSQIKHVNIVLDNDVDIVFWVDISENVAQNADTFMTFNDGSPVQYSGMKAHNDVTYALYRYNNVLPQDLGDIITAKMYVGNALTSTAEYSVKSYCQYMLTNDSPDSLKTLVSDLLVYGTEAQALVNDSEEEFVTNGVIGLVPSDNPSDMMVLYDNVKNEDLARGETASIDQSKLTMTNGVELKFNITLPTDEDASDYTACMTVNGREQEINITSSGYFKTATLKGVYVYELFDNASVSLYKGNIRVSNSMNFSVASYLNALAMDSEYEDIAYAYYNLGYSAHVYAGTHTAKMPGTVTGSGTGTATYDDNGTLTYTCSLCGATITSLEATHIRDFETANASGTPSNGNSTNGTLYTLTTESETLSDGSSNKYFSIVRDVEKNTGTVGFGYYFSYSDARLDMVGKYGDNKEQYKGNDFTFAFDVKAPKEGIAPFTLYLQNTNISSGTARYGRVLDITAQGAVKRENAEIAPNGTVNSETWTNITITISRYTSNGTPYIYLEFYINGEFATSMAIVNELLNTTFTKIYFASTPIGLTDGSGLFLDNCVFAQGCVRSYLESVEEHVENVNNRNIRELVDKIQNDFSLEDFSYVVRWDKAKNEVYKEYQSFVTNPTDRYDAPEQTPKSYSHPRLLFNSSNIPSIVANIESNEHAKEQLLSLVNTSTDGILTPTSEITPQAFEHTNYNTSVLRIIEAKALYYALFKDDSTGKYSDAKTRGYQAIYAMKNYILTFDVQWKASDQCRYYGDVMYFAALVYDWCYDLLTDDDKDQFRLGVQNLLCDGTNNNPMDPRRTHDARKLEGGFPALFIEQQSSLTGHGAEAQVLRDYFSFSIAIYDEDPSWYNYVGGMIYADYIDAHNYFYSTGFFPDGSAGYNVYRFLCDLHNAWLFKGMGVEFPYNEEDMASVIHGLQSMEIEDLFQFATADGSGTSSYGQYRLTNTYGHAALISSYLFNDDVALAIAERLSGYQYDKTYFTGQLEISVSEYVILTSIGLTANENYAAYVDNVEYHDGYQQQVVSRDGREEDSVVVLLQGGQHYPGGHTHHSAGSFQIWYKGMLTRDDGLYDYYGSNHHHYYHMAAVAHNTLLVYNPDLATTEIGPNKVPYYIGGQRYYMNMNTTFEGWLEDDNYSYGKNIGMQTDSETNPTYVYFANNITNAYDKETVNYVERSIFTLYTGDEETPMVMFIFDNIESSGSDAEKTFLLQCVEEPVIDYDNRTVTVDNGEGKMVLTSLLGSDGGIYAYGRTSKDGKVDPENATGDERFYLSNVTNEDGTKGYNLMPGGATSIGDKNSDLSVVWGHVELDALTGNTSDYMMNVLYVSDSDTEVTATPTLINGDGVIGATFKNYTSVFLNDPNLAYSDASFTTTTDIEGDMTYYVGGIGEGNWTVTINDKPIEATFEVTENGRMLTFTGEAGEVVLTPEKTDIPDGTLRITYYTNGGKLPEGTQAYYTPNNTEAIPLPTPTKDGSIFKGWFADPEFTTPATEVPAGSNKPLKFYALWVSPIVSADYTSGKPLGSYGISHSAQNGGMFKIVKDKTNYMLWTEEKSGSLMQKLGGYSSYASASLKVSFIMTLGRNENDPIIPFQIFIRDTTNAQNYAEKKVFLNILKLESNGNVYLGTYKTAFAQIPSSGMTTIRFVLDFEAGRMYAYDENGTRVQDISMAEAGIDIAKRTEYSSYAEWFSNLKSSADASLFTLTGRGAGSLRFGEFSIISDDVAKTCRSFGPNSTMHNWDDGVVISSPDSTSCKPGVKLYTCLDCEKVKEVPLPSTISHSSITMTATGSKIEYECEDCKCTFTPEASYYLNGSSYDGLIGVGNADNYTTLEGTNQPTNDKGYYSLINNSGEKGDMQLWIPSLGPSINGFSSANNSLGFLSFKVDALTEHGINFNFVDTSADADKWSKEWCLTSSFFNISAPEKQENGSYIVKLTGWDGLVLKEFTFQRTPDFIGWVDVNICINLNPTTDQITLNYYIDGECVGSVSKEITTKTNAINSICISGSTSNVGSGLKIHNIAFGFSTNGKWELPIIVEDSTEDTDGTETE